MALDGDYVFEGLLRYNYLPMVKEHRDDIAPLFTTESLDPDVGQQLIDHFSGLSSNQKRRREKSGFDQIEYRTTRYNNLLRLMHVPHPLAFARLCGSIREHWNDLAYISTNAHSQIKPKRHADGRLYVMGDYEVDSGRVVIMESDDFPEDLLRHLKYSHGSSYFVEADVSGCFPSIYSHAIPWALVGHSTAKADRDPAKWYNELDARTRNMKRGETQGVPVGPATSNIINEVILARVDEALADEGYRFDRYIDDYRAYCDTREKAEAFIRDLERQLGLYLLGLNARKVSIDNLPRPFRSAWVSELAQCIPSKRTVSQRVVADVLDAAVVLQSRYPEGSVTKYAARVLSHKLTKASARLACRYLLQLAFRYPIVLPVLCDVVGERNVHLDERDVLTVLDQQIVFRRSDMICWSLYLLWQIHGSLPKATAQAIVEAEDCMGMAALLSIRQHDGLVKKYVQALDVSLPYELDKNWLLIHELRVRGETLNVGLREYCEKSGLKVLADNDVTFLE